MKKIISLFSVAVLALTFATGCTKTDCKDADGTDEKTCQTPANFEGKKDCTWVEATKKCEPKKAAEPTPHVPSDAVKAKCNAEKDETKCPTIDLATDDAKAECKWNKDAADADKKCEAVAKAATN